MTSVASLALASAHAAWRPSGFLFESDRTGTKAPALQYYAANNQRQQTMRVSSLPLHHRLDRYVSGCLGAPPQVESEYQECRRVKLLADGERAIGAKTAAPRARQAEVIALRHFNTKLFPIRIG